MIARASAPSYAPAYAAAPSYAPPVVQPVSSAPAAADSPEPARLVSYLDDDGTGPASADKSFSFSGHFSEGGFDGFDEFDEFDDDEEMEMWDEDEMAAVAAAAKARTDARASAPAEAPAKAAEAPAKADAKGPAKADAKGPAAYSYSLGDSPAALPAASSGGAAAAHATPAPAGAGVSAAALPPVWQRAVAALPTLQAVLEGLEQRGAQWQPPTSGGLTRSAKSAAGGRSVLRLELPFRALAMYAADEPHPLLAAGETLGFDHLELHTPAATEALVTLLMAALQASAASPHLAPALGWALLPHCSWQPPPSEAGLLGALPVGASEALCVWVRKGVSILSILNGGESGEPYDFASLYADQTPHVPMKRLAGGEGSGGGSGGGGVGGSPAGDRSSDSSPSVPPLGLSRLRGDGDRTPSREEELPALPAAAVEAYGDFVLFAIAHTLAVLQAAIEISHNELTLEHIQLLPAADLEYNGTPLASLPVLMYQWGKHTYAFKTPTLIPVMSGVHHASARLDGVMLDAPPPSLLPPLTATSDLQTFWRRARSQIKCGELVRRRLHALLMQGAPYDGFADPWAQYRVPSDSIPAALAAPTAPAPATTGTGPGTGTGGTAGTTTPGTGADRADGAVTPVAALQFEWMAEPLDGRDCSSDLLARLRSEALLTLRDRARTDEDAASSATSAAASAEPGSPLRATASRRVGVATGSKLALGGGKGTAEALQEMYLKARIREADDARREEEHERSLEALRTKLAGVPSKDAAAAIEAGWDGLKDLLEGVLGDGTWARTVNSVPDEWEEEEALAAISDLVCRPKQSEYVWLLLERD